MLNRRIVEFPRLAHIPDPKPAKAWLRPDVAVSVQRSRVQIVLLGERNPDAALLIGRSIDDFMPPPDDDGGQTHPGRRADEDALGYPILTNPPRRQAARLHLRRMREAAHLRKRQIGDEIKRHTQRQLEELQRNPHHGLMALLRDMAANVSSAA